MAKKKSRRSSRTVRHAASKKTAKKPTKTTRLSRLTKATPSKSASASSKAMGERAIGLLRFTHRMLVDMLAGIPDERGVDQPSGLTNHKLWTIGHMAVSHDWTARMIDGKPSECPADWEPLFNMGSKPSTDAGIYPSAHELRAALERAVERIIAAVAARTDAELAQPTIEDTGGYAKDKLDVALKAAWHEGWHLGQACDLRRAMGVPPLMG